MTKKELNLLSGEILDAAVQVHKELGPGLLESVYEFAMGEEFKLRDIMFVTEKKIPVFYKGIRSNRCFRIDFLVENEIIVELKAVDIITSVHEAQLISYLKLAKLSLGLLINFNVPLLKEGFRRYVNNFYF